MMCLHTGPRTYSYHMESFSENELKVFQCFINPRYPRAVRSFRAVVKETGLCGEDVMAALREYEALLFAPLEKEMWSFNFNLFAAKFSTKYPQLFEKYHVHNVGKFLLVAPKSVPMDVVKNFIDSYPKTISADLAKAIDQMGGTPPVIKLTGVTANVDTHGLVEVHATDLELIEDDEELDPAEELSQCTDLVISFAM